MYREPARKIDEEGSDRRARTRALLEALAASAVVTALVTAASAFVPERYVAITVAVVFLGATWVLVWQRDDARVVRSGLSLAGLVLPGPVDGRRLVRGVATALGWALALAAITFVPFYFGWQKFWHPHGAFSLHPAPWEVINQVFGQLVIIALPEEAFYRGYLQSRLDDAFPGTRRVFGADVGLSLVLASVIFALGHFATIREPTRLAVFFPSLAFGWLRARTGGIGAGVAFHASCNVFSELLGRGFRVYF